jgi:DNA-binding NarL/FixJ family response regulator
MSRSRRIRVLLVEDQQMFLQGLERALGDVDDIEVVGTAATVEDAVNAAKSLSPDVVLMDFFLPDGDGALATEKIKAERPEAKVVMLTAYEDEEVLVASIEARCSGFVTKSKALGDAVAAVRAAAAGEAIVSQDLLIRLLPKLRRDGRGTRLELTARESEVLDMLARGYSTKAMADQLYLSVNTVRNHTQALLNKLNAHSKLEAVATAVREGLIRFPA